MHIKTHLHIDFVVFAKNEIPSCEGCNESEDWMISACQLLKKECGRLIDGGEKGKVASMLKGSLQDELDLLLKAG